LPDVARPTDLIDRFSAAAEELEARYADELLDDEDTDSELRTWIDGEDTPLPWTHSDHVTTDEWFFITTLYGEMTLAGQRTHIRKYYPSLFVEAADRDMRSFVPDIPEYRGLRSRWMSGRLTKMGDILRGRDISMDEYTQTLRTIESAATPENPMPALDTIIRDHKASGWKTLSVFVRDCVGGNSFPIDSRVEKELNRHLLPVDERQLISLSLAIGSNSRRLARMFYGAGGTTV
jgi:hypothetical protein